MAIEITPELEHLVHGIFAGGQFASETDVLATALQLLQQREQLRFDLQQGIDELDRGERLDVEHVFAKLRQRAKELDGR
jgi:antitoxin ParD1/3/4